MTKLENDKWLCMDYEDFTNFCITILRKSQWVASQERIKASLLDYIYDMIATKEKVLGLYQNFLNNYQQ